ncbi:MAG: Gldg family protein [Caldilineaceae bacterium]
MKQILSITRKELDSFFGSPMALIFMAAFLLVTLFTFFWVDSFFSRGIADVRPLFQWMPLLLIFLVAALTMRQWSDEQRMGTQEILLTLPVKPWKLVIGKFIAVMTLVLLALVLTLPLPITVAFLGNLDWGPVVGGYLASLLLAAAYAALGLFISSRTDNQIVALISTGLVGGILYLVGTDQFTSFFPASIANILHKIGTGSRFESIERGVIDLRDLIYYLSITGAFLLLNAFSIDTKRWGTGISSQGYRRNATLFTSLAAINLLVSNLWLTPLTGLRADLTQQKEYSLSPVTKQLLSGLQEPLLIRGYISEKSHPLLMPLRPYIQDLLREYQIAGGGKVTAEVIDPTTNPDLEAEANQTYNIRPVPFQVTGRYEASVINSYFDILVRYGDQDKVLNFRDIIQVDPKPDGSIDVRLRNLEYDLTSAIKKVVYGFQSASAILATLDKPAELTLYVSKSKLPDQVKDVPTTLEKITKELSDKSGGKLVFKQVDPEDPAATEKPQDLESKYGIRPYAADFLGSSFFYLNMLLTNGSQTQQIALPNDVSEGALRDAIESTLKRTSNGFLKVVGLWTPPATPTQDMFGQQQQPFSSWNRINQQLSQEYTVKPMDLADGKAPTDVDTLVVVLPENMTDKQRFAVDQFLMRGGSVIVAAGNFKVDMDQFGGGLTAKPVENSLRDMLAHYGIDVQQSMVMDPQNVPFPLPYQQQVNGFAVQKYIALSFPFFVDVRSSGMDRDSGLAGGLNQVTMNFVSPVVVSDTLKNSAQVIELLKSTDQSWLRTNPSIQPNIDPNFDPNSAQVIENAYPIEGEQKSQPLAVAVTGSFSSFFAGKPSPLSQTDPNAQTPPPTNEVVASTILTSPATSRLIVIGSGEFLDDAVFNMSNALVQDAGATNLQFLQNAVNWTVEDSDLLTIRARGNSTRLLEITGDNKEQTQRTWEFGNYIVALLGLLGVSGAAMARRRNERPMELA